MRNRAVAIVIASDSPQSSAALAEIIRLAPKWPRPLVNPPHLISNLDRDKLYRLLQGIEGIDIPAKTSKELAPRRKDRSAPRNCM